MELCAAMTRPQVDARVVQSCREGDREAFRLLFVAYKDWVYRLALYSVRDAVSAEDITQDVFVRVFTRIGQFRSESEFTTWIYRLVVNACVDERRRRRRFAALDEVARSPIPAAGADPEACYARVEIAHEVAAALGCLSPEIRVTVLLRHSEQLSYDEMAKALGCSKGTIASRLNRAHRLLARKLAHLRGEPTGGG